LAIDAEARAAAARIVHAVAVQGRSLDAVLEQQDPGEAFVRQLAYNTLRFHIALDAHVRPLLQRPPKGRQRLLHALLLCGAFELVARFRPAYAVVDGTVAAAAPLGFRGARGFVNAVLRKLLEALPETEVLAGPASHPPWLNTALGGDWGRRAPAIARANDLQGPMTVRVNRRRSDRNAAVAALEAAGIAGLPCTYAADGITLEQPVPVPQLPGFADGLLSVQDESAQLASTLLAAQPGPANRVLDACAAPGGKAGHLCECLPEAEVLAVDADADRLRRVAETFTRLQVQGATLCADASHPEHWWDGRPFDRILLDAPCSGTGVIRRHPDIKLLRRKSDIGELATRQRGLLEALWPTLAPGGCLLYTTCSILRRENDDVIHAFLAGSDDARPTTPDVDWAEPTRLGLQRLPGQGAPADGAPGGGDGFYYCVLTKAPA
jgi:16S rRNA (cytosine967-C5)-methyltransferase